MVHELTALADGTLPTERRRVMLQQVSASPKLARAFKQQRVAIEAIRRLETPASTELHERIRRAVQAARR